MFTQLTPPTTFKQEAELSQRDARCSLSVEILSTLVVYENLS